MYLNKLYTSTNNHLISSKLRRTIKILVALSLVGLATQVFAIDLLKGTEASLLGTLQGTGKTYLYIAECLVSLFAYIQTKNVMVLVGIIVVAVFFNIMLKMIGAS